MEHVRCPARWGASLLPCLSDVESLGPLPRTTSVYPQFHTHGHVPMVTHPWLHTHGYMLCLYTHGYTPMVTWLWLHTHGYMAVVTHPWLQSHGYTPVVRSGVWRGAWFSFWEGVSGPGRAPAPGLGSTGLRTCSGLNCVTKPIR